jgi:hypothetical protein
MAIHKQPPVFGYWTSNNEGRRVSVLEINNDWPGEAPLG